MIAGKATFTIKNTVSKNRFTYRIKRMKTPDMYDAKDQRNAWRFVQLMTGPNNELSYSYFANIKILNGIDYTGPHSFEYQFGKKAKVLKEAQGVKVFEWVLSKLISGTLPANVEIWHEGTCCKCGRKLTDPDSIERGLGPECAGIIKSKNK